MKKKVLILFVMAIAINVSAQKSVLLRLNYNKGDVYLMDMKISQSMGAVMSMDMNVKMSQEIKNVTGDEYLSEMKIAKVMMDVNQSGMNMSYDSSKGDGELDQMGQMMKSQVDPMLKTVITSKGNTLGEVISTTVEPNIPGTSDFTNQPGNVIYPKEKVKIGTTWSLKRSYKGIDINFTYVVKSISSKLVALGVSGNFDGMTKGNVTGNISVDKKSGVPLKSSLNMDMNVQGQAMKSLIEVTMSKN